MFAHYLSAITLFSDTRFIVYSNLNESSTNVYIFESTSPETLINYRANAKQNLKYSFLYNTSILAWNRLPTGIKSVDSLHSILNAGFYPCILWDRYTAGSGLVQSI